MRVVWSLTVRVKRFTPCRRGASAVTSFATSFISTVTAAGVVGSTGRTTWIGRSTAIGPPHAANSTHRTRFIVVSLSSRGRAMRRGTRDIGLADAIVQIDEHCCYHRRYL